MEGTFEEKDLPLRIRSGRTESDTHAAGERVHTHYVHTNTTTEGEGDRLVGIPVLDPGPPSSPFASFSVVPVHGRRRRQRGGEGRQGRGAGVSGGTFRKL